jgi:hypothetical protein
MLRLWDALVGCAALLGIVITAFEIMLQIVEVQEAMRRVGMIVGCTLLLIMLPAIIVGIWWGFSAWQKLGVLSLLGVAVIALGACRQRRRKGERHGSHSYRD